MSFNFAGLWTNEENKESLKIIPLGSDEYRFISKGESEIEEVVPIYLTNIRHALLAASQKFGRSHINMLSADTIQISDQIFKRKHVKFPSALQIEKEEI